MKKANINNKEIPKIGLGTWRIRGKECEKLVKKAINLGYRNIDTAQHYKNEKEVGEGIKKSNIDRKEVFLTTKVWKTNLKYNDVIKTAKESLEKLDTDYLDLLLIHWPNKKIDTKETLAAMQQLKKNDLIKEFGVSNFPLHLLKEANKKSNEEIFCNQMEYHPFISHVDLLNYCQEKDILFTAYSPLAKGEVMKNEVLKEIGKKHEKSPAQVSLRYLIQQKNVIAIPKSKEIEHIKQNIDIFDFSLSDQEISKINNLPKERKLVNPY